MFDTLKSKAANALPTAWLPIEALRGKVADAARDVDRTRETLGLAVLADAEGMPGDLTKARKAHQAAQDRHSELVAAVTAAESRQAAQAAQDAAQAAEERKRAIDAAGKELRARVGEIDAAVTSLSETVRRAVEAHATYCALRPETQANWLQFRCGIGAVVGLALEFLQAPLRAPTFAEAQHRTANNYLPWQMKDETAGSARSEPATN